MASLYPGAIDTFTDPSGTSSLSTGPDHAGDHTLLHSSTKALENTLGTTAGTALFGAYGAADKPLRHQSGTVQQIMFGTLNNGVLGTPAITGGTYNNGVFGTPTLQSPTINGQGTNSGTVGSGVYGTSTLVLQVAKGEFNNGTVSGLGTVSWANGDRQQYTVSAAGTIVFTNAVQGQILVLRVLENSTGGFAITIPAGKWSNSGTVSLGTAASAINLLSVYYDGANYLYQLSPSFA